MNSCSSLVSKDCARSCGCHNQLATNGWLKTTEAYSVTVLGDSSVKSRGQQGHTPCRGSRQFCSLSLLAPGGSGHWLVAGSFPSPPLWSPFLLFSVSLIRTLDLGSTWITPCQHLSLNYIRRDFSQIRSHSQALDIRTGTHIWGTII